MKLLLLSCVALVVGCSKPICGGGRIVDDRPLTGVLAELGVPEGATLCRNEPRPGLQEFLESRWTVLGKSPAEAAIRWKKHLEAKGWKETTEFRQVAKNLEAATSNGKGDCLAESEYQKAGTPGKIRLTNTYCEGGPGWNSLMYVANGG